MLLSSLIPQLNIYHEGQSHEDKGYGTCWGVPLAFISLGEEASQVSVPFDTLLTDPSRYQHLAYED